MHISVDIKDKRALLERLLKEKAEKQTQQFPLSEGQKALWLLYRMAPESPAYHIGFTARITSEVDSAAMRRALQALVARHPMLRTRFYVRDGAPEQEVRGLEEISFEVVDASQWSGEELHRMVSDSYRTPFNLESGPVFRATLFTCSLRYHIIQLVLHHIAGDGWSLIILLDEFRKLYVAERQGTFASLAGVGFTYAEYVKSQRDFLSGHAVERLKQYWSNRLNDAPTLDLPSDRPRTPMRTFNGASHPFTLDRELSRRIKELARAQGVTLFVVLLSAFMVLLHRHTSQDDLIVGTPVSGRDNPDVAGVVGYFVDMLCLRSGFSADPSFAGLLRQVRQTFLDAMVHKDYPFPLLVESMKMKRDPSRSPIFQIMFILQQAQRSKEVTELFTGNGSWDWGELLLESYLLPQQEGQFDLTLEMGESRESISGAFKYNVDLFDRATIERMEGHYRNLLESVVSCPEERVSALPLLSDAERHKLLVEWNSTDTEYPKDRCIHELFEVQVEKAPEAIALVHEERSFSYAELNARANRLAHYLRDLGVKPDDRVAICMERGLDMVVGLLAILKAGGAYVPLDPAYPAERLAYMLEDSGPRALLTQSSLKAFMTEHAEHLMDMTVIELDAEACAWANQPDIDPDRDILRLMPEHLAYVIYTSGSTGMPKGVMLEHRGVVNFLNSMKAIVGVTNHDCVLALTTLAFDIAGLELYLPLICGARMAIVDRATSIDPVLLGQAITTLCPTILQATPATWRMLIDVGWPGVEGLKALCGGEALTTELASRIRERTDRLWNVYGPTETTIWSTVLQLQGGSGHSTQIHELIGRPIANTLIYLLDAQQQLVPIGVAGELYIGGDGVARGYLNRPELTAERFLPNPFVQEPEARLYKTGDLARYLPDGNIEFLGRNDFQVKIRGFRIELGEIEAKLASHPAVREAMVIAREDVPGEKRLVAYLTGVSAEAGLFVEELRVHLAVQLPDYMLPTAYVQLESLPLTPNGKLDRNALPAPQGDSYARPAYHPPQGEVEEALARIWMDILKLEQVGRLDHFFELGGHSLLAVQLVTRVQQELEIEVPLQNIFTKPRLVDVSEKIVELIDLQLAQFDPEKLRSLL